MTVKKYLLAIENSMYKLSREIAIIKLYKHLYFFKILY